MTHRIPTLTITAGLFFTAAAAHAATWDGDTDLDWFEPTNWTGNSLPPANDNITIASSAGTVFANSGVDINGLTVAGVAGNTAAVQFNADFTAAAGSVSAGTALGAVGTVTMNNADGTYGAGTFGSNGGTGTFNLTGNSAVSTTGIWQFAAGGSTSATTTGTLTIQDTASLTLGNSLRAGSTTNTAGVTGTGTVNIIGGTLSMGTNGVQLGGNGGTGIFNLTSGSVTSTSGGFSDGTKGTNSSNPGWEINISGGTMSLGTGSINMTDGWGGTLRITGKTATINSGSTGLTALGLESANLQQKLVFDLAAGPGHVSAINLTAGGADLDGINLIINSLPNFAITAGQTIDLVIAERAISVTGLLFTDNTAAAFTWAVVANPNETSGTDGGILRLTATQTVLIPEPASLALLGLGGLLIASRRKSLAA